MERQLEYSEAKWENLGDSVRKLEAVRSVLNRGRLSSNYVQYADESGTSGTRRHKVGAS